MAKAKRRTGSRKGKGAGRRGKPARVSAKKAAGKRARAARPRGRAAAQGTAAPVPSATPIVVPGAWPFPMIKP